MVGQRPPAARSVRISVGEGLLILLVAAIGVALAVQGWRSWMVDNDLVEYIDAAHALVSNGTVPDHGVVTSLGSYAPPGIAWFGVPGALMFTEPQMLDVPGNVLLHLGTLFGIFLLARALFGTRCALLAVVLYGLSERGLLFAGSLGSAYPGPRAHPFFYVWITYWTYLWVARDDARYLGAALLTWAVGMYVFMELAPALFILPAAWAVWLPRVRVAPVAGAAALALVLWYPYLRFEAPRQFADVRSQLLVQPLASADYASTLCIPTQRVRLWQLPVADAETHHENPQQGVMMRMGRRVLAIADGLTINFQTIVPSAAVVLLLLTLAGLLMLSGADIESTARWPTLLGIALLAAGALLNEIVIERLVGPGVWFRPEVISTVRTCEALAVLCSIAVLARRTLATHLRRMIAAAPPISAHAPVIAIALAVPWVILLLIAEWGRQDRLMGIWPLQVIVLAFASLAILDAIGSARTLLSWAGATAIVAIAAANPLVVSRIADWRSEGWSGSESTEEQAADFLANLIRTAGGDHAVIGYRMFEDTPPQPPWRFVDDRWRYGEEFNVLLQYRHAIANLNRCGESLSARDDYRIVVEQPPSSDYRYYFDVPTERRLQLVKQFGVYQLFRQDR